MTYIPELLDIPMSKDQTSLGSTLRVESISIAWIHLTLGIIILEKISNKPTCSSSLDLSIDLPCKFQALPFQLPPQHNTFKDFNKCTSILE